MNPVTHRAFLKSTQASHMGSERRPDNHFQRRFPRLTALPPSGYDPAHLIRW
jgi:hypothetical protein